MLKKYNVILNGFKPNPNDTIDINSLSLLSLIKHNKRLNIKINGVIIVTKFGIK